MRSLAVFACLIFLELLSITDANPFHSAGSTTGHRQSTGRRLVNLQRFIRNDPNLKEDYVQQFDNIEATVIREPLVPKTDEFSGDTALEQGIFDNVEASSTIQTPVSFVISADSSQELRPAPLPLDVDFQDTTESLTESITQMSDEQQDVSMTTVIFDSTSTESNIANKEFENLLLDPEIGTQSSIADILAIPQALDGEMEPQSSNPTDSPHQSLISVPTTDLPFIINSDAAPPVVATDASTEISESTKMLEYSTFSSSNEDEQQEEQENISSVVMKHLPEIATEEHGELQLNSNSDEEEEYPVTGSTSASEPLKNIAENSPTTEAPHQSTSVEPSALLDFPLFYAAVRVATVPPREDPLPLHLNPAIWPVMKTSDSFSANQQLLAQQYDDKHQSELQNEVRPQFYPEIVAPQFKPSSSLPLLYPEAPNSFYTFNNPTVLQQSNQPKFRQATAATSYGPPRAPYPHPHENNNNPFYRPFNSAPPKPRMLIFPPISNTRENFRFRVNWADQLMGRSDWA